MKLDRTWKLRKKFVERYAILASVALIGILVLAFLSIMPRTQYQTKDHMTYIKDTKHYSMYLSYPMGLNQKLQAQVTSYIEKQTNRFLDRVEEKKDKKQELKITDTMYQYGNTITLLFSSNQRLTTMMYDQKKNTILKNSDFLVTDPKAIQELDQKLTDALYPVLWKLVPNMKKEDLAYRMKQCSMEDFHFIFHEKGVTFFFGNEFMKEIKDPIRVNLSYAQLWNVIDSKQIDKKNVPTKEQIEQAKLSLPNIEGKKVIALTFDDGPGGTVTRNLLDGLRDRNVKVTFFQLGTRAERFPDIVARAKKEGHEIGNHSYDHQNLKKISDEGIANQINTTNERISNATNTPVTLLRPPYGSVDDRVKKSGMILAMWSIDTLDWKSRNTEIVLNVMKNSVKDGDVILLHDLYQTSVDATLQFIDYARGQGYEFVTFGQLAQLKGYDLTPGESYYSFPNK